MKSVLDEFENFSNIVDMFAAVMGENCEVVLHDFTKGLDSTIVKIVNGHVTSREVGGCGTNFGLEAIKEEDKFANKNNYIIRHNGHILRSSTVHLRGGKGEIIGAICINYDITDLLSATETIKKATGFSFGEQEIGEERSDEVFVKNVGDLIEYFINNFQAMVNKPVAAMTRADKIEAVRYFDKKGVFLITRSGDRISEYLSISKHTLYQYLDIVHRNKQLAQKTATEVAGGPI